MKSLILGWDRKMNKLSNSKRNCRSKKDWLIFINSWFDSVLWSCVQIYHMTILYTQTLTALFSCPSVYTKACEFLDFGKVWLLRNWETKAFLSRRKIFISIISKKTLPVLSGLAMKFSKQQLNFNCCLLNRNALFLLFLKKV